MSYHALCLLDLSSGQLGELKVYADHPSQQGQLAPMETQPTGTFRFLPCAGLTAAQDTSAHVCMVTLPDKQKRMDPALFCRACRLRLSDTGAEGYVIVDLHDLDHIQAHPVQEGMDKVIRDYHVSVTGGQGATLDMCVTGLL